MPGNFPQVSKEADADLKEHFQILLFILATTGINPDKFDITQGGVQSCQAQCHS